MAIPRIDFFDFMFGVGDDLGRGIRTDQIMWSVSDPQLTALLATLGAAGNTAFALDAAPDDADGADGDIAIARISATELRGYKKESGAWTQVWTFSGGVDDAAIDARVKEFARAGSTTKPLATDIALDPHDDYQPNTTYEIGQNIAGGVRRPQWVPRPASSASFFVSLTTRPTPAQIAPGGWVAGGGHVLVTPDDGPEEIWARYLIVSDLVKVATFADHIIRPDAMGRLPAATDNIGRVGLVNNHFYRSVGEQGSDKVVTFADYGPTRTEPPTRANDEILYAGSFANPPIGNYVLNALAWDRGSEVWIRNQVHNGASWVTTFGPPDYHQGNLFQTNSDAAVHVPNASYIGRIYIIGHGVNQKPKVVTGYTAPVAPSAEWIPIGLTIQDVAAQVSAHNVIADAHQDIRGLINGLTSQIASLMAGTGLYQGAWDTDTSYSQTQIVHHGDGASRRYYMYLDPTARSGEDPAQSGYWQELYDGIREHPGGGNNIRVKKGELIRIDRDVYLCITAPANPIGADALKVSLDFIWLNEQTRSPWRGPWMNGVAYLTGDIVTTGPSSNYTYWISTNDHTGVNPTTGGQTSWKVLSGDVRPFNGSTTYNFGDPVTQSNQLYIYKSSVARSSSHSPATHPNYWFHATHPTRIINLDETATARMDRGTIVILTEDDAVYLCTTDSQASNLRNATYIRANAGLGGIFIHLNPVASVAEGSITKNQLDAALQEEITIVEVSEYNPTGVTYHSGSSIVRVGTVMYQCRQGYTSSTFDNRGPTQTNGITYWDSLLVVREVLSDPGSGVDGVMFVW